MKNLRAWHGRRRLARNTPGGAGLLLGGVVCAGAAAGSFTSANASASMAPPRSPMRGTSSSSVRSAASVPRRSSGRRRPAPRPCRRRRRRIALAAPSGARRRSGRPPRRPREAKVPADAVGTGTNPPKRGRREIRRARADVGDPARGGTSSESNEVGPDRRRRVNASAGGGRFRGSRARGRGAAPRATAPGRSSPMPSRAPLVFERSVSGRTREAVGSPARIAIYLAAVSRLFCGFYLRRQLRD